MWKCKRCLLKLAKKKKSVKFCANVQHMVTREKCDHQHQKVQTSPNNCISDHLWDASCSHFKEEEQKEK